MTHQYEPRWRAATRPAKIQLTGGERRRLGIAVSWAICSPRKNPVERDGDLCMEPVQPCGGWQPVEVWVTAGFLYVPTWRTVQRKRRRQRAAVKARRGWA